VANLIVTGVTGFIGSSLEASLTADLRHFQTWNLRKYSCSQFLDAEQEKLQSGAVVIHLAGDIRSAASWTEPESVIRTNLNLALEVLEYCRINKCKLIVAITALQNTDHFHSGDVGSNNEQFKSLSPYHWSKSTIEDLCRYYSSVYSVDIIGLRIFSLYGPYQPDVNLIPSVVKQIFSKSETIRVQTGTPVRDFVYISDVIAAIRQAVDIRLRGFHTFEIGTGLGTSVEGLINLMQLHAGTNKPILETGGIYDNDRPKVIAATELNRLLGWSANVPLYAGLKSIIEER
jgi:nucleoside-diphosphate-sugar epimerase